MYRRTSIDAGLPGVELVVSDALQPAELVASEAAKFEADLVGLAPQLVAMEHGAATRRCEQLIRSYDPCISCATHFLRLEIER